MRGIWVQAEAAQTPAAADEMLDRVERGGLDTILYCAGSDSVAYQSELLRWKWFVSQSHDPLAYVVERAHGRGLNVQAWWCCGVVMRDEAMQDDHPDWDLAALPGIPDDYHWLNFALDGARQFAGDVVLEIAARYDVEAVHLDYIRYPYWGRPLDEGWYDQIPQRPDDLPDTVAMICQRLKAARPDVCLTAAVASSPEAWQGCQQHWPRWIEGGYVDQVAPMAYLSPKSSYVLLERMETWRALPGCERIAPGLSTVVDFVDDVPKTPEELLTQIRMCRAGGWPDVVLFAEHHVTAAQLDALKVHFSAEDQMFSRIATWKGAVQGDAVCVVVDGQTASIDHDDLAIHDTPAKLKAEVEGQLGQELPGLFFHINRDGSVAMAIGAEPPIWPEDEEEEIG